MFLLEHIRKSITKKEVDAACDILKGAFVINRAEYEKFCHIDIVESDGTGYLTRVTSYAERLAHNNFYEQIKDIVTVGLARYRDKYCVKYSRESPFVLYEKYSRRDISLGTMFLRISLIHSVNVLVLITKDLIKRHKFVREITANAFILQVQ